jgi:hypothetical protein
MAVRISRSDSALESVTLGVLDGDGAIGDSIGITDMQCMAAADTTPVAARFTTEAISTVEVTRAAQLAPVPSPGTLPGAALLPTVPAQRPGLSTETPRLLGDTLHPAARLASARALLAGTLRADRPEAIRRAEAPALEEERRAAAVAAAEDLAEVGEDLAAAVAGIGNRFGRA